MKLSFNTTFHPQIYDQIERVNGVLNQYFRNYMSIDKKDWGEHLGLVEFYYNSITHLITKMSSFKLALGKEDKKPINLTIPMGQKDHSKEAMQMVKGCGKKNA
jgi:hypothetical protein